MTAGRWKSIVMVNVVRGLVADLVGYPHHAARSTFRQFRERNGYLLSHGALNTG